MLLLLFFQANAPTLSLASPVRHPNSIQAPGPEPEAIGGRKLGGHQNGMVDVLGSTRPRCVIA
ncbi:hypothetical protein KUCAC02_030691, partial [Chaenocephalus aceratus]